MYVAQDNWDENELLDTLVVTATRDMVKEDYQAIYNPSFERKIDLIHTKLELSFDWPKQEVYGKASLDLTPLFYPIDEIVLDAKNIEVHSLKFNGKAMQHKSTADKLIIALDRKYTRNEKINLFIDYTARPSEGPEGGSAAITSDKGLFFINPNDEDKTQQIWTQGETENNSRWFPTIDKPNERCSQEIILTVQNKFKTLSNGKLINSKLNPDGTRTDHWKQELEHAPYLFMLAIGEYAVVEDKWNSLPLYYYVEQEYEQDAKQIFNHTPEMLEYFSDILDYPYPWDKYAQVVCKEYVSGAMENTGAVIFGEFVQKTSAQLEDAPNDNIVAHELFHHWFGDLVTCESWANLTLNEGFANYSEYLWQEYKYGDDAAEHHRFNELSAYVNSAVNNGMHPLIYFGYGDKEQMFDAHSYNKGGLVLHMLRAHVGDDAFFSSLNKYLVDNEFTAVEADQLRLAFEATTGMDLNWFFDQWYFGQGHPIIEVNYTKNPEQNEVLIELQQIQNTTEHLPVFTLKTDVALYYKNGSVKYHPITIDKRQQEISINTNEMPELIVLDGKRNQLALITENRTDEEWISLFKHSDLFLDKLFAMQSISASAIDEGFIMHALQDDYYLFREQGLSMASDIKYVDDLKRLALNDPHSSIRSSALMSLLELNSAEAEKVATTLLDKEKSYVVKGQALDLLYSLNPAETLPVVDQIAKENPKPMMDIITGIYAKSGKMQYLDFFQKHIEQVSQYDLWGFSNQYVQLSELGSSDDMLNTAKIFDQHIDGSNNMKKSLLMYNMGRIYKKLNNNIGNDEAVMASNEVKSLMEKVIAKESDTDLINQFRSYLN